MTTHSRRPRQRAAAILLGLFFMGELLPEVALAQNYGTSRRVARRTSRRTATRHDAYYGGASTTVVAEPVGAQTITALPAGCVASTVSGIAYQQCGGVRYRPYYQGDSLVYVAE
ncbi:hypothetical protein D7X55_03605 [Corallococcus sp. AB049A]|uniref:hypothetical protein n=1 Tax=Corallococcus sp. AB049A TaxID=2316721 RepID=UPI000EA11B93|nr:hypothetical protein [Corallococcus sp. AB049A]RKH50465.1 hypothetical protein D7Y23_13070 [Corallococcus sp. AB050B]RKI74005.1 hypothetical protein D7X55_03605 [Corallococcus sp. AB049A]